MYIYIRERDIYIYIYILCMCPLGQWLPYRPHFGNLLLLSQEAFSNREVVVPKIVGHNGAPTYYDPYYKDSKKGPLIVGNSHMPNLLHSRPSDVCARTGVILPALSPVVSICNFK